MKKNAIVLAYARKYEPQHLVDELLANMAWVDAAVCLDQRNRPNELWSRSDERVAELRRMAMETGAKWCIIMAPDERLQDGAARIIKRGILNNPTTSGFTFKLREMWTPTQYRADGDWDHKIRRRITRYPHKPLKGARINLDCELVHLKMIEPANRVKRALVHTLANTWDNKGKGFAHMVNEEGLTLKAARPFSPAYQPYDFDVPEHLLKSHTGNGQQH